MTEFKTDKFEKKWQKEWDDAGIYKVSLETAGERYYLLVELPYPSGDLHMGHWFTFAVSDVLARYMRMKGKNVFMPIGFDAFGLPAENAAIKRGIHPEKWTYANIDKMKKQFASMGTVADFEHGVITCDPGYFRWNQWIFLKMLSAGLAYKGRAFSNWCPSCATVLASENVEAGRCWRCQTEVVQKEVSQWFLKITDYAEKLLWPEDSSQFTLLSSGQAVHSSQLKKKSDRSVSVNRHFDFAQCKQPTTDNKVDWPKSLRESQNYWIGKSEGVEIRFSVLGSRFSDESQSVDLSVGFKTEKQKTEKPKSDNGQQRTDNLVVFTKFPETIFGVTYMVLAPEHGLVAELLNFKYQISNIKLKEIKEYLEKAKRKSEFERTSQNKEKTGVFTGVYCTNPLSGKKVPVWVADYVIAGYGTGAVMGVPASDIRDFEFAKKFGLEIIRVIGAAPGDQSPVSSADDVLEHGWVVNSGQFDGLKAPDVAKQKFIEYIEKQGFGQKKTNYHLHDWSISRQRYWGTPIPIIYCPNCMKEDQFSVLSSQFSDGGRSVGQSISHNTEELKTDELESENRKQKTDNWIEGVDYLEIEGKKHKIIPVPFGDLPVTLPYEVDYAPTGKPPLATADEWVKTKCPVCAGNAVREVETMDTFVDSSWYFLRYLDPSNAREIFDSKIVNKWLPADVYVGGAEHTLGHTLYSRFFVKFFRDLGLVDFEEYARRRIHHGIILGEDGSKMSKSKGNVVNPDVEVAKYGADSVRTYLAFLGPYDIVAAWNPGGIRGVHNFYLRVWKLVNSQFLVVSSQLSDGGRSVGQSISHNTEELKTDELESENRKQKTDNRNSTFATQEEISAESRRIMHKTIKKVGEDIERIKFNTGVAALMEWLNFLEDKVNSGPVSSFPPASARLEDKSDRNVKSVPLRAVGSPSTTATRITREELETFLLLLAPYGPHIAEELWNQMGNKFSIHQHSWPEYDESAIEAESIILIVQVNGKVRDRIMTRAGLSEMEAKKLALGSIKVTKHIGNKEVKKFIYIRDKIISLVV